MIDTINALKLEISQKLSEFGIEDINIRYGARSGEVMIEIITKSESLSDKKKILSILLNITGIKSIYHSITPNKSSGKIRRRLLFGSPVIYEKIGSFTFQISPDTSPKSLLSEQKKLDDIKRLADIKIGDSVLVLNCGAGAVPIYISTLAKKVIGIDLDPTVIRDAIDNARINKIKNVDFLCDDPNLVTLDQYKNYILILFSNKLPKKLNKNINANKFKKIIYANEI